MTVNVIQLTDPFRPTVSRKRSTSRPNATLYSVLCSKGLIVSGKRQGAFFVRVNGKPVLQAQWNLRLRDGDTVVVQNLPRGGGGSNPLQIVAMIAIVALSVYTGGAVAAAYGSQVAGAIASAAVMIGGSMILNMMFKPPSSGNALATGDAATPTYSIAPSGNTARLLQPLPVLYGREKIKPDYAASPFTEIQGTDQYLYQLFMLTQGECDIEQILVGDTIITNVDGVQYEVIRPYQRVTLFPTNVVSSPAVASQELLGPNQAGAGIIGPFTANAAGTTATSLAVDLSASGGLFKVNDQGKTVALSVRFLFEYQTIDNNGNPSGPWTTLVDQTVTSSSRDPWRATYKIDVPAARYQVRGQRITNTDPNGQASESIRWDGLKAYLPSVDNFGYCTMLALVMKATNQLSSASSRDINVIATRKLNTWSPVNGWSLTPTPTRNIAHAAMDMLHDSIYGRGLKDSQFDLQHLYELAQVYADRGDRFDYYYSTSSQLWDSLKLCLKTGRAMPIYYAGMIEFIRNAPQSIPTQMFQPENMVEGSFSQTIQFAEVDTPDFVQIQFRNEETWQNDQVDCALPGRPMTKPAVIELPGVTNRDQAWREGITMAAINELQRRMISFTTDIEGVLPKYNDLCKISHDSVAWGYSGKVESIDRVTGKLVLSESVLFEPNVRNVIAFRKKNGSSDGPYTVTPDPSGEPNIVRLTGLTPQQLNAIYISPGNTSELTLYQFGPVGRDGVQAVLYSASPQSGGKVALTFVNYDANVFAAETGGIVPPAPPVSNLPKPPVAPIVDRVTLEYTLEVGQQTIVASATNGAGYYEFEVSRDNGNTWVSLGRVQLPQLSVSLSPGPALIRVRAVGIIAGPWQTISVDVQATTLPLVEIQTLVTKPLLFGIEVSWAIRANNGGMAASVEIWQGLTNDLANATRYATINVPTSTITQTGMGDGEAHFYFARVIDNAGRFGPWFNNGVGVLGRSSDDAGKILDFLEGEITKDQLSAGLWKQIQDASDLSGVYAAIDQERETRTSENSAMAQDITTLKVSDGENKAAIQNVSQVQVEQGEVIAAANTVKVQATQNGKNYFAGITIGLKQDGGTLTSEVLVLASTFGILNGTDSAATATVPFVVKNGTTYIRSAMIEDASIDMAKIGTLQSKAVDGYNQPLWKLDPNGAMTFRGSSAGNNGTSGMLIIENNGITIYSNGVAVVQMSANL